MDSIPTKNYIYIVFDTRYQEAVVIDPVGDINKIENTLSRLNLKLKGILITHTHFDHIGLVAPIVDQYQCKVWVSSEEYKSLHLSLDKIVIIDEEASFNVAKMAVKPLLTPGHTNGSICYLIGDNLITGDTLFIEGCGTCFGENSDPALMFSSLKKLKNIISPTTSIFPGHSYGQSPGKPFKFLLANNIYLQFTDIQEELFISFRMRKSQEKLFNFN